MPSGFDERSANYVMAMINRGENVPLGVQNAAAKIQLGEGSDRDAKTVNNFLGNRSHGARALGRVRARVGRVGQSLASISRDVELLDQAQRTGGSTTVPQARLLNTITKEFDKLTKSKLVRSLAGDVAEAMGKNRVVAMRFLKFLGGAARLAGTTAAIAQIPFAIAERYFKTGRSVAQSMGRQLDLTRRLEIDPRTGAAIDKSARGHAGMRVGAIQAGLAALGLSDAQQRAAEEESAERKATIAALRGHLNMAGGNRTEEALADMAAAKGKTIGELTSEERAEALDAAGSDITRIENYRTDSQVKAQVDREFGGFGGARDRLFRDALATATFGIVQTTDQVKAVRTRELMIKRVAQVVKTLAQREQDLEISATKMRSARTPGESKAHRMALEQSEAEGTAYRSRHQAWSNR